MSVYFANDKTSFGVGAASGKGFLSVQTSETTFNLNSIVDDDRWGNTYVVRFSANREWMIVCFQRSILQIYKYNSGTSQYDMTEQIIV